MKKIKVAQIGTSRYSHGTSIWKRLNRQKDLFEVVGYAFPEKEREKFPEQMGFFNGYREMTVEDILNDSEIEAVAVETEEIYLTKYAIMVAETGKHLHMEKPGGMELSEFRRLISILKAKELVFSIGYMYRFNPKIIDAIEKVKRGELGEIYCVEAHMSCRHDKNAREWLQTVPDGMMFYLGGHLIDLIYRIQGEPTDVIPLSLSTGIDGVQTLDYGMTAFKYPKGISFAKTVNTEMGSFLRRQLVISGEKGTIEIKPLEILAQGGQYTVLNECYCDDIRKPWDTSMTETYDRYDAMIRNFAEMIRGKENPYSYDYELGLYELILRSCGRKI